MVVVPWESLLRQGRIREVPAAKGEEGRFIELEGSPDLIVEIGSDSSKRRDRERLPRLYAKAGVPEIWLIDCRGADLVFASRRTQKAGARRYCSGAACGWSAGVSLGV